MKNLLTEWRDKYINTLIKVDTYSSETIEKIKLLDTLVVDISESFIPEELYLIKNGQINWLSMLLKDPNQEKAFYRLVEIQKLIFFFNTLNIKEQASFKKHLGDYKNLPNYLFELETHLILRDLSLNTSFFEYYEKEGNKKPLDIYMEDEGVGFLVECTKIHNKRFQNIMNFFLEIFQYVMQWLNDTNSQKKNRKIYIESMFRSFIGIKNEKINEKKYHTIKEQFVKIFEKYHYEIANVKANTILYPQPINEKDFDMFIENALIKTSEDIAQIGKDYAFWFTLHGEYIRYPEHYFQIHQTGDFHFSNTLPLIIEKIKYKIDQHKTVYELQKTIFVEIEDTNTFVDSLTFQLNANDFKHKKLQELAEKYNVVIIFLIKRFKKMGFEKEFVVLGTERLKENIKLKLNSLEL